VSYSCVSFWSGDGGDVVGNCGLTMIRIVRSCILLGGEMKRRSEEVDGDVVIDGLMGFHSCSFGCDYL
jgi:hypothetical protein